jgi:hypothetical protein
MGKVLGRQIVGKLKAPELPSVTSRPIDTFYQPQQIPVDPSINELARALDNLNPSLRKYQDTKEEKLELKEQGKATTLFNENRLGFKQAVKNGLIPEGANPYFIKHYLKLDLENQASDFNDYLFYEYGEKKLQNNTDPDAFEGFYQETFDKWREENKLDFYEDVDLASSFFPNVQNAKNSLYSQHIQARIGKLEDNAKIEFGKALYNNMNDALSSNLLEIYKGIDVKGDMIVEGDERIYYAVGKMQKNIDDFLLEGALPQDINDIVRATVIGFAKESGDPELLKILDLLEQRDGVSFSSSVKAMDEISSATTEIVRDTNFEITTYNLRKGFEDGQKLEGFDNSFLELIDSKENGVVDLTIDEFEEFIKGEFTTPNGTKFQLTREQRDHAYAVRTAFLNGALSTYNDPDFMAQFYVALKFSPDDQNLETSLLEALNNKDITTSMYRTLKTDLKDARQNHQHEFMTTPEYKDLDTYIDNGVTGFRSFLTSENAGQLPLIVNEVQATLQRYAIAYLKNPDNKRADGNLKVDAFQFAALMEKKATEMIIKALAMVQSHGDSEYFNKSIKIYKDNLENLRSILN